MKTPMAPRSRHAVPIIKKNTRTNSSRTIPETRKFSFTQSNRGMLSTLVKRDYPDSDVGKVIGGNTLRLLREAWKGIIFCLSLSLNAALENPA